MKIVVNALSVRSGGGLVSLRELLPALRNADNRNEYAVVIAAAQSAFIGTLPSGIQVYRVDASLGNVLVRILFEQLVLPFILWRMRADWLYSLGNQTVLLAPCRIFLVMENTNPYSRHQRQWSRAERFRLVVLRVLAQLSCWRATKVRFLTRNSSDVLGARLGVPEEKRKVIAHGVSIPEPASAGGAAGRPEWLPVRFVFAAANIAPHKNLHTLMRGFDRYVQLSGYDGSLVIAGIVISPDYAAQLDSLRHDLPSGDRILLPGWIDPANLAAVYAAADMFVFPSIEETFGMPLLEAMACGTPVLASKAPESSEDHFIPFAEICGASAVYFDPFDPEDLAAQMLRVLTEPGLRERLIASGRVRAREFSWSATAAQIAREFSQA